MKRLTAKAKGTKVKARKKTVREKITEIIYKNSTDDSACLRIKFENIQKVIDQIESVCVKRVNSVENVRSAKNIRITSEGLMNGTWQIKVAGIKDCDLYNAEVCVLSLFKRKKQKTS
jgi:hypothetical protein